MTDQNYQADEVIAHTKQWVEKVVIGLNFCPFAAKVVNQQTIHFQVSNADSYQLCLEALMLEIQRLDETPHIETTLLILPVAFPVFNDYLELVSLSEKLMKKEGYEGIYQVASFHPLYLFAGSKETDAENYTNRSVYPMLHLLRESSIDKALESYKNPDDIPERNIRFTKEKGLEYMKMLLKACGGG